MDKQIINVLNELSDKCGLAIDWSSEKILPYLNDLFARYIRYEITKSVVSIAIEILILLVLFHFATNPYANKKCKINGINSSLWQNIISVSAIVSAFLAFILMIAILYDGCHLIECYTVPEKVIFEYLQSQI